MQSGSSLNQFNDDDSFSGGPCPSCRLAINKETGRLKFVSSFVLFVFHKFQIKFHIFVLCMNFSKNADGVLAKVKHGAFVSN